MRSAIQREYGEVTPEVYTALNEITYDEQYHEFVDLLATLDRSVRCECGQSIYAPWHAHDIVCLFRHANHPSF